MKRVLHGLAWALLILLLAAWPTVDARLPVVNDGALQARQTDFAGVLRLWYCEGWQPGAGTLIAWLNACIERFEKRHPGVYVQCTQVSEETLGAFDESGVNPPDMLLFSPGMLDGTARLLALEDLPALLPGLDSTGMFEGVCRAAPVAMGGYAFAVNERLLEGVPNDFATAPPPSTVARAGHSLGKAEPYLLNAPLDGRFLSWSAALLALLGAREAVAIEGNDAPLVGEGVDLGLPAPGETAPVLPTEAPKAQAHYGTLPGTLPSGFRAESSVYATFTSDVSAVIPVTQREIRRLQLLEDTGRAPEWHVEAGVGRFTDQLAMIAVVDWPREEAEARARLSKELVVHLLGEDSQKQLTRVRALPVRSLPALYAGQRGMAQLEAAYRGGVIRAPNAFDTAWREAARRLLDEVQDGQRLASEAFEALCARLPRENQEDFTEYD